MIVNHADSTALHTAIFMTMGRDIEIQDDTVIQIAKHSLHEEPGLVGAISLTKPAAVFSVQTNGDIITQMPPVETLGKTYYIPAIDLTSIGGDGTIIVVSTEDSTYVIIKGAYDQVRLTYEPHHDKTNKMSVRPEKTQISLGIRAV